jgi:hypothetical protein
MWDEEVDVPVRVKKKFVENEKKMMSNLVV